MVGLAFPMVEPYPGYSRIVNMIKSCCVHNGGRTWCDSSGPLAGGVPCGEGTESKVGGLPGSAVEFACPQALLRRLRIRLHPPPGLMLKTNHGTMIPWYHGTMGRKDLLRLG